MKVYQAIAHELKRDILGQDGAYFALEDLKKFLPYGSGFDGEIEIEYKDCGLFEKYLLEVPYHCMNENGYYDGWIDVSYTITPSFSGYNINENWHGYKGKYKEILRDYMVETLVYALDAEIEVQWDRKEQRNFYSLKGETK